MYSICPECGNEKIKVKVMEKRVYDPSSQRTKVNEEVPMVEYHCHDCGWTVLLEDPPFTPEEYRRDNLESKSGRLSGVRRGKGD